MLTDGSVVFVLKSSQRKCLNTKFLFAKHQMSVGGHLVSHRPCSSLSAQALGCRCLPRRPLPGSQRGRLRAGDPNRCSRGYGHACGGLRTPLPSRLLRGSTGADAGFPEAPFWRRSLQDFAQLFTQCLRRVSPPAPVPVCSELPRPTWHVSARALGAAAVSAARSPRLAGTGDCLRHCCVCSVAGVCTYPSLSHMAQNEDVDAFFPPLSWGTAFCQRFPGTIQVGCSK